MDTKPRSCRPTFAGALLAAVAFCGGCSVLFHADANQCSSTTDCTARGAAFADHVCQAGTCITMAALTNDGGADARADAPSDARAEAGDEGGSDGGAAEAGCSVASQCVPTNSAHMEVACDVATHSCLQLTSDECPFVLGDYSGRLSPPIFVGAFATLPPNTPTSHPSYLNYKLAIDELGTSGGIPAGPGTGLRIPCAVVCNPAADVHTSMVHLASDVHVPGVVAALDSVTLRTMFVNDAYAANPKIFVINPFGANSTLTSLTTDQLLWHMLGQPGDSAAAYGAFFPRVETYVRSLQGLGTAPLRVATVTAKATDTQDLAAEALKVLTWNGQSVTQNAAAGNYIDVAIDSVLNGTPLLSIDNSTPMMQLHAFKPNVIISFASAEFATRVLQVYENDLAAGTPGPTPFYLIGPYNQDSQTLLNWIGVSSPQSESKRKRIAGIGVASALDQHELLAYQARFQGSNPPSALGQENYYDAMYFMIYSIVGAGHVQTLGGPNLAQGMLRLLSGNSIDVGPSTAGRVFGALGDPNGTISLFGTLGPPNFTIRTGARVGEGSVYCVGRNPDNSPGYTYDVLRLAASTDGGAPTLGGTFTCFGGL